MFSITVQFCSLSCQRVSPWSLSLLLGSHMLILVLSLAWVPESASPWGL